MQGILEGIISTKLLPENLKLFGLKTRLDAIKDAGYVIAPDEEKELEKWSKLRNALSHCPPEQHRPATLLESDLIEYRDFIAPLLERWLKQKDAGSSK